MELTKLILTTTNGEKFILEKTYKYKVNGLVITIPEGFETDLASVPKVFRNIVNSYGKNYTRASIVHDWLYSKECDIDITRKQADDIFLQIMKERGVNFIKRQAIYLAVRTFGKSHFRKGS